MAKPVSSALKNYMAIIVQALIVLIAVHIILIFGFSYSPSALEPAEDKPFRTMTLDLRTPQRLWHHEVAEWIEYQNPAFSRPDYKFGYSRYAKTPLFRSLLPVTTLTPPGLFPHISLIPFSLLVALPFPSDQAAPSETHGFDTAGIPEPTVKYPKLAPNKYPLALLDGIPLQSLKFKRQENPPDKPTRLTVSAGSDPLVPRVIVTDSCGDLAFDQNAVRAVLEFYAANPAKPSQGYQITVWWQKEEL